MIYKYTALALLLMSIVVGVYFVQFYLILDYKLSKDPSDWVDFSDFVGGILGPLLSFLSLLLLLHSLKLQNQANTTLINEANNNRKNEKFRAFETHFFNLIDAQRTAFDNFKVNIKVTESECEFNRVDGVIKIEDYTQWMRDRGCTDSDIVKWIEEIDTSEKIYNTLRVFCNIVKVISERLANTNGFTLDDRRQQFHSLISLTEFSQLRLILIGIQFIDCPPIKNLKRNEEFISILKESGLDIDIY